MYTVWIIKDFDKFLSEEGYQSYLTISNVEKEDAITMIECFRETKIAVVLDPCE